jgi:methylenetetrahydrofolate reductase (NADPH)
MSTLPPAPDISISFEFFPPKSEEAEAQLWRTIAALEPFAPRFVSVTYGAGGSTRERTHRTLTRIRQETGLEPAAHLTCIGAGRAEILDIADQYWANGVRHIVALRGDPPGGPGEDFVGAADGFANATELTAGLCAAHPFEISVACYPEGHPESPSFAHDIAVLKAKQDAGATRAITQFFFSIEPVLRFVDAARRAGITIPIVPGIMLQPNFAGLSRMAKLCGATMPDQIAAAFHGLEADPEARMLVAATIAAEIAVKLRAEGFADFHFYTLNRRELAAALCRLLGRRMKPTGTADVTAKPATRQTG